jgi:hypothetical protein
VSLVSEISNLIGNAVPKNFSWDDLLRFVPEGKQIVAVMSIRAGESTGLTA